MSFINSFKKRITGLASARALLGGIFALVSAGTLAEFLTGSIALADEARPQIVLEGVQIVGHNEYMVARDAVDCGLWYYVPTKWTYEPGSFTASVQLKTAGQYRLKRYYPEAYYTLAMVAQDSAESLEAAQMDIINFRNGMVDTEANRLEQGTLKAEDALYAGKCDTGTSRVRLQPFDLNNSKLSAVEDFADHWITFQPKLNGQLRMVATRRVNLLHSNALPKLINSLQSATPEWASIFTSTIKLDGLRVVAEASLVLEENALADFVEFWTPRRCQLRCEKICNRISVFGITLYKNCRNSCAEFNCIEPIRSAYVSHLENTGLADIEITALSPLHTNRHQILKDLFDDFITSNFATNASQASEDVTHYEIGKTRNTQTIRFATSIRQMDHVPFAIENKLTLRMNVNSRDLNPLTDFQQSPFYQCISRMGGSDSTVSFLKGYFTAAVPCPMYPAFNLNQETP